MEAIDDLQQVLWNGKIESLIGVDLRKWKGARSSDHALVPPTSEAEAGESLSPGVPGHPSQNKTKTTSRK